MNQLTIIGNLCSDPQMRTTPNGIAVCTFTVAVNRRRAANAEAGQQPEADFFRVTAWRQLAENCSRFLSKGRKVCVVGDVRLNTYTKADQTQGASLEVTAGTVEFLSPAGESSQQAQDAAAGFVRVEDDSDLPF